MNYRDLQEMVNWMRENGVIHMAHEGTTITLDEVAPVVYAIPADEKSEPDEEDDGFETPQQRIRAQLQKSKAGMDKTDD